MSAPRVWVPRLTRFVLHGMVYKLRTRRNAGKSDWRELPRPELVAHVRDELRELVEAVAEIGPLELELSRETEPARRRFLLLSLSQVRRRAQLEAADVGNVAMMLYDRLEEDIRRDERDAAKLKS